MIAFRAAISYYRVFCATGGYEERLCPNQFGNETEIMISYFKKCEKLRISEYKTDGNPKVAWDAFLPDVEKVLMHWSLEDAYASIFIVN